MIDALKEDAQRMEDIAADCGRVLREPYQGDQDRIERYLWALSVLGLHVAQWILKKEKSDGKT